MLLPHHVPLHTQQRRLVNGTLNFLRNNPLPAGTPAPTVKVREDGSHWVMDGHHRLAVARERKQAVEVNYLKVGTRP